MKKYAGKPTQGSHAKYARRAKIWTWMAIFFSCTTLLSHVAYALTAADVSIRIPKNQTTTINLTPSIGDVPPETTLTLTVSTPPSNGTAQEDGDGALAVTYMPNTDFVGEDQFRYTVSAFGGEESATGTVTIIVGTVDLSTQTATTSASANVAVTIENICAGLAPGNTTILKQRCNEFTGATPEQKANIAEQLAPEEVAAQAPAGNTLAAQQLRNVSGRLAALRQGSQGLSVAGLNFVQGGKVLSAAALRQNARRAPLGGLSFASMSNALSAAEQPAAATDPSAPRSNLGLFLSGTISGGDRSASANEDNFKHKTYGLTAGSDYRFSHRWVAGGALGIAKSAVDFDEEDGGLDVKGRSFTAYSTFYLSDKTYLEAVLAYNTHQFKSTRNIDYTTGTTRVQASAVGKSDSKLYAASLGGGYEVLTSGAFTMNLSARYDSLDSTLDGYSESGADGLNLTIQKQTTRTSVSSLGMQMSYALSFRRAVVLPQLTLAWNHNFNDDAVLIKGSFVADETQTTFAFNSDTPDRDYTTVGLGASVVVPGGNTGFVHYETTRGKSYWSDYNIALGLRWELP